MTNIREGSIPRALIFIASKIKNGISTAIKYMFIIHRDKAPNHYRMYLEASVSSAIFSVVIYVVSQQSDKPGCLGCLPFNQVGLPRVIAGWRLNAGF